MPMGKPYAHTEDCTLLAWHIKACLVLLLLLLLLHAAWQSLV